MTGPEVAYADRCAASAVWAALGDALGFISELTDAAGIRRRAGTPSVVGLVAWKRRIGGKFGPDVVLPKGCYSDDTQLRLATGRAIGDDGEFDVEAFAKVEVPVFTSYALGAGRGTMGSAENLRRGAASWAANFHDGYHAGGGNGAAMRVQPHVWARQTNAATEKLLLDVAKNVATTHGHPRALVGAAFHALILNMCLESHRIPAPEQWADALEVIDLGLIKAMKCDLHFATAWMPEWSRRAGMEFDAEVRTTIEEMRGLQAALAASVQRPSADGYRLAVQAIGGFEEASRGSGTKTAALAAYLAWLYREEPLTGLIEAANAVGSDTDTIGTMTGALLGAAVGTLPAERVADQDYIVTEARRLARLAAGERGPGFRYPDMLDWSPPRTSLDAVGYLDDERSPALAGLGRLEMDGAKFEIRGRNAAVMRWATLPFGQRILVKMRAEPQRLPDNQRPATEKHDLPAADRSQVGPDSPPERAEPRPAKAAGAASGRPDVPSSQPGLWERRGDVNSVDDLSQRAIASGFDPRLVGEGLLLAAEGPHGVERAIGYAAIIAKARMARARRPSQLSASQHAFLDQIDRDPVARAEFSFDVTDWLARNDRSSGFGLRESLVPRALIAVLERRGIR